MPLIHSEFKLSGAHIGHPPPSQPPFIEIEVGTGRLDRNAKLGKGMANSGPDGGVVTQRTANPCTPVRFRLGPPPTIKPFSLHDNSGRNWCNSAAFLTEIPLERLRRFASSVAESPASLCRGIPTHGFIQSRMW